MAYIYIYIYKKPQITWHFQCTGGNCKMYVGNLVQKSWQAPFFMMTVKSLRLDDNGDPSFGFISRLLYPLITFCLSVSGWRVGISQYRVVFFYILDGGAYHISGSDYWTVDVFACTELGGASNYTFDVISIFKYLLPKCLEVLNLSVTFTIKITLDYVLHWVFFCGSLSFYIKCSFCY